MTEASLKMMDKRKTKQQLIDEISFLRARIMCLEKSEFQRGKAEEALRDSEEKYRNLVESTLDLIFIVNEKGNYTYVNPRFENVTGYSTGELTGRPFTYVVAPEYIESTIKRFKRGILGQETPPYDAELLHKSGHRIPVEFLVSTQYDPGGKATRRFGIGRDITERKKASDALRRIAADLAKAQELAHVGSWRYIRDTKRFEWSGEMLNILGLDPKPDEQCSRDVEDFIHPDDWPQLHTCIQAALDGAPYGLEIRIRRPDGTTRDVYAMGEPEVGKDGKIRGLFGSMQDITERKESERILREQQEQLRMLSAKLSEVEESEKKRIARELHDQVGQNLTVVGINLNVLRSLVPVEAMNPASRLLEDSVQLVEQIAEYTRSLMSDLRPPDMDEYGLVASIRWYSERFSMRTGVEVIVEGTEIRPRPTATVENNLFRIVQEVLTNISKHARAQKVKIAMHRRKGILKLRVMDDGIGFDPARLKVGGRHHGWGLLTMAERAEMIGGRFSLESRTGKGTVVFVEVPL